MLTMTWLPGIAAVSTAIFELSADIRSVKVPLERSIREVMIPSIQQNFDVGGRPPWAEWSAETDRHGSQILVDTGALMRKATQVGSWTVDGQQGEAVLQGANVPFYGVIHQEGWTNGPARPWAVIQEEDIDSIHDVFDRWVTERLLAAGLL